MEDKNKDVLCILWELGMLDEDMSRETFEKVTSKLHTTFELVDSIMTNNDETTIKKFLTVLLYKGE